MQETPACRGDLGNVDPHGGAFGDQADTFRALAAGLKQTVGHLALDGAGNITDTAVGALLQRVDRIEQNRRIDPSGADHEAELLAKRLDLERDHARDVEPFERPEGEHAVDAGEHLRRELSVAERALDQAVHLLGIVGVVARDLTDPARGGIGGEHENRLGGRNSRPVAHFGDEAVVPCGEEPLVHLGMRLFKFVEQHDRVRGIP